MIEEDEIDLRPYFRTLMRRWKLILGLTLGAAAAAAAISMAMPPTYEANSMVAAASLGAKPVPDIKSYLDLATSDSILVELAGSPNAGTGGSFPTVPELRTRLKATAGSDPSLINLRVVASDPERAAGLARDWSQLFVRVARSTFNPAKDNYDQLQAQLAQARIKLRQAEEGLSSIESRGQLGLLQAELASQRNNLAALLASKTSLRIAQENARSIQGRLQQTPPNSPANATDDTAIMLVQSSILGVSTQFQFTDGSRMEEGPGSTILPGATVQLQVPDQGDRTVASQIAALQGIVALTRDRADGADEQIAALRPSVMELETKVSSILIEQGGLLAQRDSLRAVSRDMEAKTNQAKALLEAGTGQPRVILEARADASPQPRGTARNAIMAAVLGLILGAAAVLGADYHQSRRQSRAGEPRPVPNA